MKLKIKDMNFVSNPRVYNVDILKLPIIYNEKKRSMNQFIIV